MKKTSIILVSAILIGIIIIFNQSMKNFFVKNNEILKNFNMLQQHEYGLNYYVLQSTLFLYSNNDNILKEKKLMKEHIDFLLNNQLFQKTKSYKTFKEYKRLLHNKFILIYKFEKYNLPIKNSLVFLTDLNRMLPMIDASREYKERAAIILSNIFLVKNALYSTFYEDVNMDFFKHAKIKDKKFNRSLILNIRVFKRYFPKYSQYLKEILNTPTKFYLDKTINNFVDSVNKQLNTFNLLSYLIVLFIILVTGIILLLIHKLEKDYKIIKDLTYCDYLTGLNNRYKFDEDIKNKTHSSLIILNIDHFKTYNDHFGTKIGDKILKEMAKRVEYIVGNYFKNYILYRFGADEFGILVTEDVTIKKVESIISYLETPLKIGELEFEISFSAGVSNVKPFLEKADLTVKEVKKDYQTKVKFYEHHFDENVRKNFERVRILKKAIQTGNLIPVYQPIFDNKTGEINKYEMLSRVRRGNRLESIYPYLSVAKENRLYSYITKSILKYAFEIIETKKKHLSINFSMEDIENEEILGSLFIKLNEDNGKYLTIELLESEAINDYSILEDFIKKVKKFNVCIAIDDFGSGYSNFARILNLNIDIIKIDGSLIKDIDKDKNNEMITSLVVNFAKEAGIQTIAEFVDNETVLNKVKELGIDLTQGFYLSEPLEVI